MFSRLFSTACARRLTVCRCARLATVLAAATLLLVLGGTRPTHGITSIRFAAPNPAGSADCSTWGNACTLQSALALGGDQIWVKAGVHTPASNAADRAATFTLANGIAVYGGFAGTETLLSQRDPATNVTVLSGDIAGDDTTNPDGVVLAMADIQCCNSYHVVTSSSTDSTALLDGVTITAGQANGSSPHNVGGGMLNSEGSPTLNDVTFSANVASHNGGGMYNVYVSARPTLTDVTFSANEAQDGGAIYNYYAGPTLNNVILKLNKASKRGGGIYNANNSSPELTSVSFEGNTAIAGGGLYNIDNSSPTLTGVFFKGNTATQDGGGMHNRNSSRPMLISVQFEGNTAGLSGGGIFNFSGSDVALYDVAMWDNQAATGGGIYNYYSNPLLFRVALMGNEATAEGGGYFNDNNSSTTMDSVLLSGNAADLGGAIYNNAFSSATLNNVTVSGNAAATAGSGLYNYNSYATLNNVILWGNADDLSGPQIVNDGSSGTATIAYSDVEGSGGSGGSWNGALGTDGGNNIDADPLFVLPGFADGAPTPGGNHALRPGSPAVNSGTATDCPALDVRRVPRPQNSVCDQGAYERVTLALAGAPAGNDTVALSWTATGYGSYVLYQSSAPYGVYTPSVGGLEGTTYTLYNVSGSAFYEVYAQGIWEVSNRVGVVSFALVPGQ